MFQKQNFPFRSLCVSFIPTPGEPELITCQKSTGSLERDRANYKVYECESFWESWELSSKDSPRGTEGQTCKTQRG